MPWTFAHPAAVLPLRRLCPAWLSLPALVVGSLAPDFGYYYLQFGPAAVAHTPAGVLLVCVPTGLVVLVLLCWLQAPVIAMLPQPHRGALAALPPLVSPFSLRALAIATVSLVIGAGTHALWDAFTHVSGGFVQASPQLQQPLFDFFGRSTRLFNLLQHASTLVGVAALVFVYWRFLRRAHVPATAIEWKNYARLAALAVVAFTVGVLLTRWQIGAPLLRKDPHMLLVRVLIHSTTALSVLLPLLAVWTARRRVAAAVPPQSPA